MKYFLFVLILPLATFAQTGELSGSVFYKYNDYVGSRPDVGASVILFALANADQKKSTLVNLSGDFQFTKLDTGRYLLIVKSKETNESPYMGITKLIVYGNLLNKYFNFNPREVNKPLQTAIELKNDEYTDYLISKNPKPKKLTSLKLELTELSFKFFNEIPLNGLIKAGISLPTDKIDVREVSISDKNAEKIVVDFGLSYSK